MRDHIKILGVLNIIVGSLGALLGLMILLFMGGIAGVVTAGLRSASPEDYQNGWIAAPIIGTIGVAVAIFLFALSLPAIIGGWGLLNFKPWSRLLMIVISALHLFHIPIGTALGIYGLWVLLKEDTRRLLETGGHYSAVAAPYGYAYPPPVSGVAPNPAYPVPPQVPPRA